MWSNSSFPTGIDPILAEHQRHAGECHELWLWLSWAEESYVRSSKSLGECRNVCGANARERKAPFVGAGRSAMAAAANFEEILLSSVVNLFDVTECSRERFQHSELLVKI